jgi:hypothetical protein
MIEVWISREGGLVLLSYDIEKIDPAMLRGDQQKLEEVDERVGLVVAARVVEVRVS